MRNIVIRPAVFDDLIIITALDNHLYPIEGGWSYERFVEEFKKNSNQFYVATENNFIVAYAAAGVTDGVAELLMLTVIPEYRQMGIAAYLWDTLEEYLGDTRIILQTRTDNDILQRMAMRRGYEPTTIIPNYYGEGIDAQEMAKEATTECYDCDGRGWMDDDEFLEYAEDGILGNDAPVYFGSIKTGFIGVCPSCEGYGK